MAGLSMNRASVRVLRYLSVAFRRPFLATHLSSLVTCLLSVVTRLPSLALASSAVCDIPFPRSEMTSKAGMFMKIK